MFYSKLPGYLLLQDLHSHPPCSLFGNVTKGPPFPCLYSHSQLFLSYHSALSLTNTSSRRHCMVLWTSSVPLIMFSQSTVHFCSTTLSAFVNTQKIITDTRTGSSSVPFTIAPLNLIKRPKWATEILSDVC